MKEEQIEILTNIVNNVAKCLEVNDPNEIQKKITQLQSLQIEDAVDSLLVSLRESVINNRLKRKYVESIICNQMTKLIPEKYPTAESLVERFRWLRSMNMEHMSMPLSENHKLVLEVFDQINALLGKDFDYFHTGGLMGYIATDKPLERYHGDLDIFLNEEQLMKLKDSVSNNPDFELISSLDTKKNNGHEFSIKYKDTSIDVGLFLFSRTKNDEIVLKSYYYKDKNPENELLVDERHLSKQCSELAFPKDNYKKHNEIPYRVQSLEAIYLSKVGARPKDQYDASVIKNNVNMDTIEILKTENENTNTIKEKPVKSSIVLDLYNTINETALTDGALI